MPIVEKQLAQTYLTTTSLTTLYTAPAGITAIIKNILIVNSDSGELHDVTLYHDDDGTTGNTTTVFYQDASMPKNSATHLKDLYMAVASGGSILGMVASGTPQITISIYGVERS